VYDGIQVINLGALPGGTYSPALGINNSGQVVGLWGNNITGPLPLAYFWQKDQMIDISSDFGTPKSRANAINDFGQATGWMGSNAATNGNAFIWQNGQVTTLPHLPGGYRSEGLGINNLGHVVGTSRIGIPNGANQVHATAWIDGAPIDLGTFPGFITSAADDINDSGAIVGRSWNSGGNPNISRACIWQNDVMTDLNDLVPPNLGMTIYRATAINNAGQIAGTAQTLQFDVLAVLLTPKAPQLGDLNSDCTVGITDFLTLLAAWGPCLPGASCAEDLDGDSNVGIGDFLVLLANWG
jgi:probable HAF family extracellular repeat protein